MLSKRKVTEEVPKTEPLVVCDKCGFVKYATLECVTCVVLEGDTND